MKQLISASIVCMFFISIISCKGDRNSGNNSTSNPTNGNPTKAPKGPLAPLNATVKIYFENTLSMDGYINGNTGFKDVFRELLVAVDNENDIDLETEFYLLNNELTPTNFGVDNTKISEKLTPKSTANKGNKGSSNFEEILNTVLQNQEGDVISVIMADFIYSPEGEPDNPSALNKLRTYTQDAFLKAAKQNANLETRVYSFTSDFNGIYYDINNKHIQGLKTRPYYYFVIAPANLMPVFANNIAPQLKKAPGYKNEALFTAAEFNSIPTETLTATANNGRIKAREREIEVISYPKSGNLEITVLVDLTELPVDNNYLFNKNNYHLANPEFFIKDIGLVQGKNIDFSKQGSIKMESSTLVRIKNKRFSHAILFTTEGMVSEDLKFALKKKIPAWVENIKSNDDRQIGSDSLEQTKTFGFGHLIEGVSRAYELKSGSDQYFNITIPVK